MRQLSLIFAALLGGCNSSEIKKAQLPQSIDNYWFRFIDVEAADRGEGFLDHKDLVDLENSGPNLPNVPIALKDLREKGAVAGIKLGMAMGEVVTVWGKPNSLFKFCGIGPRFFYRHANLFFQRNRLVLIELLSEQEARLSFDNGLKGNMPMSEYQKLLGSPAPATPDIFFFPGELVYVTGEICTGFAFQNIDGHVWPQELLYVSVSLYREIAKH